MATNTNLTWELAEQLLRGQKIPCPVCGQATLEPRYSYKKKNTEYKCSRCGEVYHPAKLI